MIKSQLMLEKNYLSSNATILWAETQKLILGSLFDYNFNETNIKCEAKLLVNSTVKEVPSIDVSFKHNQDTRHYITDISIHHKAFNEKPNLFAVNSNWHLNLNNFYSNITGSIMLQSPVKGYTKGALATKFSLSSTKSLRGAADFELEEKKFTLAVDGMVKKITDCMLVVNITTPIVKYRNIISRFGLVNRNRHFVAEVRAPAGALGIEVKFAVNTMNDFDVILNLETPIEDFKKIMLLAKLKSDMVDFRGGLNTFVLGYVGVSRRESFEDFEYSWKVYTPLDKFEESSLVVKYVRKLHFDMEVMLKFAQKKLGVNVNGKPKQKFIGLPRVGHFLPFNSKLSDDFDRFSRYFVPEIDSSEEESDSEDDTEDENTELGSDWNLSGQMELNTIIWPTISGFLDIEDIDEEYYIVRANLNLPQGNIELNDLLYFPDLMNIRNSLQLLTPFTSFKEIELLYLHSAKFGRYYVSALELFYKNNTNWIELGYNSNYTKVLDVDLKTHDIEINLYLPFEVLPRVMLGCSAEIAESQYRANVTGRTLNTFTSLAATLESDTDFIDVTAGMALASLALPHYEFKVFFKQDLSDSENTLLFGFEEDYHEKSFARIETSWHTEPSYIRLNSNVKTNLFPINAMETAIVLNRTSNFIAIFNMNLDSLSKRGIAFRMSAKKRGERINFELSTPMNRLANVTMIGMLQRLTEQDRFLLTGRLTRNHDIYNVNGTIAFHSNIPVFIDVLLRPVARDSIAQVTFSLANNNAEKIVHLRISEDNTFFEANSKTTVFSKLNWNTKTTIEASPGILSKKSNANQCSFNAFAKTDNNEKIFGALDLVSPWRALGIDSFHLNGSAKLDAKSGNMELIHDFSLGHGKTICSWTMLLLENMQGVLDFGAENEAGLRTIKVGLKYMNPAKSNQRLSFGGNLDVDSKMNLETNCSAMIVSKTDMSGTFAIRLPAPIDDVHRFSGRYRGNVMATPIRDVIFETKYESDKARHRFASRGQYRNLTDLQTLIHAQWGTDTVNKTFETNLQMLRKGIRRELSARMKTPYFVEETIRASGFYDKNDIYHVFK